MSEQKQRVTVDIYGETYTIVGQEDAEQVRHVANIVNDKMKEVKAKNPNLDTKRLAVLTAVNAVNDNINLQEQYGMDEDEHPQKEE